MHSGFVTSGGCRRSDSGGDVDQDSRNLYVWRGDGTLLSGFPTWYRTAGIWGFISAADLTGDGYQEIIIGRDHRFLHAYTANGQQLPNWPIETYVDPQKRGESPYVTFTRNGPVIADLDGDGVLDIIIAGSVKERRPGGSAIFTQSAVMVFQPDGQRKPGWTLPKLSGPPIADSFMLSQVPALADLDDDGKLEIIVALADGTLRVYRPNGDLMWQHDYAQGKRLLASEPVAGDVTGDGRLDVIFGTYSPDVRRQTMCACTA